MRRFLSNYFDLLFISVEFYVFNIFLLFCQSFYNENDKISNDKHLLKDRNDAFLSIN